MPTSPTLGLSALLTTTIGSYATCSCIKTMSKIRLCTNSKWSPARRHKSNCREAKETKMEYEHDQEMRDAVVKLVTARAQEGNPSSERTTSIARMLTALADYDKVHMDQAYRDHNHREDQ